MKLRRIKILTSGTGRGILDNFEIAFAPDQPSKGRQPICFVGENGSGKSQLLEVLSEIFFYLDQFYFQARPGRTDVKFEIEYTIGEHHIKINRLTDKGQPQIFKKK